MHSFPVICSLAQPALPSFPIGRGSWARGSQNSQVIPYSPGKSMLRAYIERVTSRMDGTERVGASPRVGAAQEEARVDSWASDLELVRSVLNRESAATEEFVQRMKCIPRMVTVLARRGGGLRSAEEKSEIVQEVFSRVWAHLDRFEGRASLESWVYRYCAFAISESKRNRLRGGIDAATDVIPAPPTAGLASMDELRVQEAIAFLDEEVALVIELKHFEDLSFREIAEREGVSANTAKTRYYRGLRELRNRLQRGFGTDSPANPTSEERLN